jgi:hypothetical protein
MKNLKELTKLKSKHCFTIEKDGTQTPEYTDLYIRVLLENGNTKHYRIHRSTFTSDSAKHMITTYITLPDSTFYHGDRENGRCKIYKDKEFEIKLEKLSKELEKQNITFQNIIEEDLLN